MKKTIIIVICIVLVLVILINAESSISMYRYYSNRDNYVRASGQIDFLKYNETYTAVYIGFSNLSQHFDDTCFKIVGRNFDIVSDNGFASKVKIGDEVEFITAPEYFGDGYIMPIVGISKNGECLLSFEEGFENYLDWLGK